MEERICNTYRWDRYRDILAGLYQNRSFLRRLLLAKFNLNNRLHESPHPFSVGLLTTYRCNFNCEFCNLPQTHKDEISTTETLEIITQFRRLGVKRLGISGGEPLLRDDIGTIVDEADKLGFWVSVNTNGFYLPERVDELTRARMIVVSLDGPKEIHNTIRDAGSFERLKEGVSLAQKKGLRTAAIMVVTSRNLPVLRETVQMGADMGLRMFVQPVTPCDLSGQLDDGLLPHPETFHTEVRWLIQNASRLKLGNSPPFLRYLLHYPNWPNAANCRAGDFFVYVNPDGTLTPCHVHFSQNDPSAILLGVDEALKRLSRNQCQGCAISPYMEQNLLAQLNLGSIWHAFKSL